MERPLSRTIAYAHCQGSGFPSLQASLLQCRVCHWRSLKAWLGAALLQASRHSACDLAPVGLRPHSSERA
eukprot:13420411-Alexandrium_andersonii.AAC.1